MNLRLKILKTVLKVASIVIIAGSLGDTASIVLADSLAPDRVTGVTSEPTQYVGYGYNIAGGKAIYENDALMLNNPILDVENDAIKNNIKVFDGAKTEYQSNSFTRRSELAEAYGNTVSGGVAVNSKVAAVNLDINAKFATSSTSNWSSVASEEFSYYTIFSGNRPVVLQMDHGQLGNYLSERFKNDLYNVKSETDAMNLFEKYGTHLLTGYTLGGIFEMTNYYATNSTEYVKENDTSFSAQVGLALGSFGGGEGDFSFTNTYGYKDNNQFATNQYKCTTYGGLAFPGLTIDQAFSWYETLSSSGYVYQLWTDSINAGKNLVIVSIPQSSKMVPLWNLLPVTGYSDTKNCLIDAYAELTKDSYTNYLNNNSDRFSTGISNALEEEEYTYDDYGFTYYRALSNDENDKEYIMTYINDEEAMTNNSYSIEENSVIQMDYDYSQFVGKEVKWEVESYDDVATMLDARNGVIKVGSLSGDALKSNFRVRFIVDDKQLFSRLFSVNKGDNVFSGGVGAQSSPYLISTADDLKLLSELGEEYWASDKYYKMTNDIDLIDLDGEAIKPIGEYSVRDPNEDIPFLGTFDGNEYAIKNYKSIVENEDSYVCGLFGYNKGNIKNVTLKYDNEIVYKDIKQPFVIGGICAKNAGIIDNCKVIDAKYNLALKTGSNTYDSQARNNNCFGAISAINDSKITYCSVENLKLVLTNNNTDLDIFLSIFVGFVCGLSNNGYIDHTVVEKVDFLSATEKINFKDNTTTKEPSECAFGGFVGYANGCNLEDNLISSVNIQFEHDTTTLFGHTLEKYLVGGLIGHSIKSNINKCVARNPLTTVDELKKNTANVGLLAGIIVLNDTKVTQCFIANNKEEEHLFHTTEKDCRVSNYSSTFETDSMKIIILPSFDNVDVKDLLSDSDVWFYNKEICLMKKGVNVASLELHSDDTKKTFYKGEAFVSSNLKVTGTYYNGDDFEETSLYIDYSKYESNVVGQYPIFVKIFGATLYYSVNVIDNEGYRLYATQKEGVKSKHYVGDSELDLNSIDLHYVTTNGVDTIVDTNIESVKYEIPSGAFKEGSNAVTFKYKGLSCVYYVDAIKHNISKIEVTEESKTKVKEKAYNIGTRNIDFSDIEVNLFYADEEITTLNDENEPGKVVKGSECEFIHSIVQDGENIITVTYDVQFKDTFVIEGKYTASQELIDSFVDIVSSIDEYITDDNKVTSITEVFVKIKLASAKLDEIGREYCNSDDAEFSEAYEKLNKYIEAYNNTINEVNEGFESAVIVGSSINQRILVNTGFTVLGAILLLALKLL